VKENKDQERMSGDPRYGSEYLEGGVDPSISYPNCRIVLLEGDGDSFHVNIEVNVPSEVAEIKEGEEEEEVEELEELARSE
jgi:hypothetical protein